MSVLFMGSGPFGLPALERLHELVGDSLHVATVPDAPRGRKKEPVPTVIKQRASELGLPCHEFATLKGEHGPDLLRESRARLVIVADYRLILTRRFLSLPERHCYNLHGSLLPAHRGAAPVARAVLQGDRVFGVTLYQMVKELDAGPVVACREYRPEGKQDAGQIEQHLSRLAADLLAEWFPVLLQGEVRGSTPQDPSRVTLAPKLSKDEGWIDWRLEPDAIENHVLGVRPWPRAFSHWQAPDKDLLVFIDVVLPSTTEQDALPCGTVRRVDDEGVHVACGSAGCGTVILRRLQCAGKKSLPVHEFVRGQKMREGDRFVTPEVVRP